MFSISEVVALDVVTVYVEVVSARDVIVVVREVIVVAVSDVRVVEAGIVVGVGGRYGASSSGG